MNIRSALTHLGRAGVTAEVIAAEGVDSTDPAALRALVETLLGAALAEDYILASMAQIGALQQALGALLTDDELVEQDALARRIVASLEAAQTRRPEPVPTQAFEACLEVA